MEYYYGGRYLLHIINSNGTYLSCHQLIETIEQQIIDDFFTRNVSTTVTQQNDEFIVHTTIQPRTPIHYIDLNFTIEPDGAKFE